MPEIKRIRNLVLSPQQVAVIQSRLCGVLRIRIFRLQRDNVLLLLAVSIAGPNLQGHSDWSWS